MSLSKLYTAKIIANFIRGLVQKLEEDELRPEEILSYVNLAQQMVYNELPEDEYLKEEALTEANDELDFSTLKVEKIIKLVDSENGIVDVKSIVEFDELIDAPSKQFRVYATKVGEKFKLYKGSETNGYGDFTLTFVQGLTPCANEDSFLDVKDKYVPKVIEFAKKLVYEQLGQKAE